MNRHAIGLSTLGMLLLACGPKSQPATPAPDPVEPAAEPAPTAPTEDAALPIIDPAQQCSTDDIAAFVLEASPAAGCLGPRNPHQPDAFEPVTELEFQMEGEWTDFGYDGVLDMSTKTLAWERQGCAGRVRMTGDEGQYDITFAAVDDAELKVTASWTPTGGAPCDVPMTGRYKRF